MPSDSVYFRCKLAAQRILGDPSLVDSTDYGAIPGLFTELDVIARAAAVDWTQADFREAQREASGVLRTLHRDGQVVRYGPVEIPGYPADYVRHASKIIHAEAIRAPRVISTPNGVFGQLTAENDTLAKAGRRVGTARSDFTLWVEAGIATSLTEEQREIRRLKTELKAARDRFERAEEELNRLRAHRAATTSERAEERVREALGRRVA